MVVYATTRAMWNARTAGIAVLLVAFNPAAVWWTNRLLIETLATLVYTSMIAATYLVSVRPGSILRWILLGTIIGLGALQKTTFLPYVVLLPSLMLMFLPRMITIRRVWVVFVMVGLMLSPWIYRNWKLTGRFIPCQVMAGIDCLIGDSMVDHYRAAPLSLVDMFNAGAKDRAKIISQVPDHLKGIPAELAMEKVAMKALVERYNREPSFLLRKYAADALWFWTQEQTPTKTIALSIFMIPLLVAYIASIIVVCRRKQFSCIYGVHIWLVVLYYLMHLPVYAEGRYSVILLPTMVMYVTAFLLGPALSEKIPG